MYQSMPRLMKVSWVLSNIMGAVHLFITLGYWTVVYPFRNGQSGSPWIRGLHGLAFVVWGPSRAETGQSSI